jgi:DNA-binding PadR family transcriptional regulator
MLHGAFLSHHDLRAQRGGLEPLVLQLLCEKPMHGYEIIRTLEERSHGFWRPSPGSVYPILQLLEEQDLVVSEIVSGKKVYELTDKGREQAKNTPMPDQPHPFSAKLRAGLRFREMLDQLRECTHLMKQIVFKGNEQQTKEAQAILKETYKKLETVLTSNPTEK